jgi:alpha-glucosidase
MKKLEWWKRAVFYQICPRSFADSNGDGIGDLKGIIQHLDYLQDLGIDAVWMTPHYPSPFLDFGYDVSDYLSVAPEYGNLEDFKRLLSEVHSRGLYLIIDFVLNHTSDKHSWFVESRSSLINPKRDWYIWRNGRNNEPPNNWYSWFGGPAWEFDPFTRQYYYHFFMKQQPDLNWRNPEVKQAMIDTMRYWLEIGVDGFRLDAIGMVYEDSKLTNQESGMSQLGLYQLSRRAKTGHQRRVAARISNKMFRYQMDLPDNHGLMRELRNVVDEYPNKVLVGETELMNYYGLDNDEIHLIFNFPLMRLIKLTPSSIRQNQYRRLKQLPNDAWPCNTLGNHDTSRILNRYGYGNNHCAMGRLFLALLLTLPGTPFLYYGEEIGMMDISIDNVKNIFDEIALWTYRMEVEELGNSEGEALKSALIAARDKSRNPMQWDNSINGGFCPPHAKPWLPIHPNHFNGVNVDEQTKDPQSLLNSYRLLIRIRKKNPALINGDFRIIKSPKGCLAFFREVPGKKYKYLIVLNMGKITNTYKLPHSYEMNETIYSANIKEERNKESDVIHLAPYGIYIGLIRRSR